MARLRLHEDDEHAILTALWRTVGAATKRPLIFSVRQLNRLAQSVGVDVAPLQLNIGHEFLFSLQLQAVRSACFSSPRVRLRPGGGGVAAASLQLPGYASSSMGAVVASE